MPPFPAPAATSAPALNPPANVNGVSPTGTVSPGLSSVATSASEVSALFIHDIYADSFEIKHKILYKFIWVNGSDKLK